MDGANWPLLIAVIANYTLLSKAYNNHNHFLAPGNLKITGSSAHQMYLYGKNTDICQSTCCDDKWDVSHTDRQTDREGGTALTDKTC